jgi:hypothetical protein
MSQDENREKVVKYVADYAEASSNVDYLHIWLGDSVNRCCECEDCYTRTNSDWYVILLNEIDEQFIKHNIPMKVLFSFYVDTMFAPTTERLNNPDRFLFQFCPIARSYMQSITEETQIPEPLPFRYNAWDRPKNTEEAYSLFCQWKKVFPGPYSVFEYHFWRHQYRDPGAMTFARRVYEDTLSHRVMETCGCMQDGSVKSFFPNGFAEYIYAETLIHRDLDYEKALHDYYSALYGEEADAVIAYLTAITNAFSFAYMEGELSSDPSKGTHYNPEHAASLASVAELGALIRSIAQRRKPGKIRVQGLAWRLLLRHTRYCEGLAAVMREKCLGHNRLAMEKYEQFLLDFGKYDYETERYFDFGLAANANKIIVDAMPAIEQ